MPAVVVIPCRGHVGIGFYGSTVCLAVRFVMLPRMAIFWRLTRVIS